MDKQQEGGLDLRQLRALNGLYLLQMLAMQKQTTTLPHFCSMLGISLRYPLASSTTLSDIQHFCDENQLPPLTVLIRRQSGGDAGLPGPGFWNREAGEDKLSREEKMELVNTATDFCFRVYSKFATDGDSKHA